MSNERQTVVPGDWIIHDGPAVNGDRSFSAKAVRLLEESNTHYVVEYVSMGKRNELIMWKGDWGKFSLASERMKKLELSRLNGPKGPCV